MARNFLLKFNLHLLDVVDLGVQSPLEPGDQVTALLEVVRRYGLSGYLVLGLESLVLVFHKTWHFCLVKKRFH